MKKLFVLFAMMFVVAVVTSSCAGNSGKKKHKYSSQHSWKGVSIGRTCNKKRRH